MSEQTPSNFDKFDQPCRFNGRFDVRFSSFLSQHDLVYLSPAKRPNHAIGENFIDGPLLGNGDIGVVAYGPPSDLVLSIGKNDVWDTRVGPPSIAHPQPLTQADLIREVAAGRADAIVASARNQTAPFRQLASPPMPKPVADVHIRVVGASDAGFKQQLHLHDAVLDTQFGPSLPAQFEAFVHARKNLIAIRFEDPRVSHELVIQLARARDANDATIPPATFGQDGPRWWLRQELPASPTYPKGFEFVVMAEVVGAVPGTSEGEGVKKISAGPGITLLIAIVTTRDAPSPSAACRQILQSARSTPYETLRAEHAGWWSAFWQRSFVQTGDDVMDNLWYLNQYFLACCSRASKMAPGLYGNWVTNDCSFWHGDYHLDYNFQQQYLGVYSSNHLELAESYYATMTQLLPAARKDAREVYGCRGAKFPVIAFPIAGGTHRMQPFPWDRIMCTTAWVAQHFWRHYQYSMDEQFLRETAYPILSECVLFYEDYLRWENNSYVIWPTVSPEHHGLTDGFRLNRNCCIDLALIRYLFGAVLKASRILNVDVESRDKWAHALSHLPDYPTHSSPEGDVWVDVEGAEPMVYNYPVPLSPVYPGEQVGLHSTMRECTVAQRTAAQIQTNGNDSYIALALVKMRLGMRQGWTDFRNTTLGNLRHNGTIAMNDTEQTRQWWNCGPVVENFAFPAIVNETMLQSCDDIIHVFPILPSQSRARFANLRAVGAFLVTSEMIDGVVAYVVIQSLAGTHCTIVNPWPTAQPRVRQQSSDFVPEVNRKGDNLCFATASGGIYIIDRAQHPFEGIARQTVNGTARNTPREEGIGHE